MTYEFEIIMVKLHHNRGNFFFAKHLGEANDFKIPDNSLLGDIPIHHYPAMQPLNDKHGIPQFDIFVFQPMAIEFLPENYFEVGQVVKLTIE